MRARVGRGGVVWGVVGVGGWNDMEEERDEKGVGVGVGERYRMIKGSAQLQQIKTAEFFKEKPQLEQENLADLIKLIAP